MGWLVRHRQERRMKRELSSIDKAVGAKCYAEAISLLEAYLRTFPRHREGYQKYIVTCRLASHLSRAETFLRELVRDFGQDNPNPNNYLAASYYLQGKITGAKALWEQVVKEYPDFAPAYSNLGAVYMHLGKNEQALLQFKVAIQLEPRSSVSAYNNIAEIYMAKGEYVQALWFLQEASLIQGGLDIVYANLGHCYLATGDNEAAVSHYERCLKSSDSLTVNQSKAGVYTNLVRLYLERHDNQSALDCCLEGISDIPHNAVLWSQLGQVYLARKDYADAVKAFRKSLALSPMSPRNLLLHRWLALAYYQLGKFGKATAEYRRGMAWHPDLPRGVSVAESRTAEEQLHHCKEQLLTRATSQVYQDMADAYFALGDLEEAITAYETALRLNSEAWESYVGLGTVYYALDQHLQAIKYFTRALEVNPESCEGHLGLGLTYLSQGSTNLAIIKFKWAVTLAPTNPKAFNFLGRGYHMANDLDHAEEYYRKALSLAPGYAQAHNNLGQLLLSKKQYIDAVTQFRLALQIIPDDVPALCNLGRALNSLGQVSDAQQAWRDALKINPNNPVAERYLAMLEGRETTAIAEV